jgi:hypothetical protein
MKISNLSNEWSNEQVRIFHTCLVDSIDLPSLQHLTGDSCNITHEQLKEISMCFTCNKEVWGGGVFLMIAWLIYFII